MKDKILLVVKNVTFTHKKLIVKNKKSTLHIDYDNVKSTSYHKKNLLNYILIWGLDIAPGCLLIYFKEKIGRRSSIAFRISHSDLHKLPQNVLNKLMLFDC